MTEEEKVLRLTVKDKEFVLSFQDIQGDYFKTLSSEYSNESLALSEISQDEMQDVMAYLSRPGSYVIKAAKISYMINILYILHKLDLKGLFDLYYKAVKNNVIDNRDSSALGVVRSKAQKYPIIYSTLYKSIIEDLTKLYFKVIRHRFFDNVRGTSHHCQFNTVVGNTTEEKCEWCTHRYQTYKEQLALAQKWIVSLDKEILQDLMLQVIRPPSSEDDYWANYNPCPRD